MLRAWADGGGGPTESRGLRLFLRLAHACQREPQTLSRLQQLQAGAAEVSQAEAQRLQQVGPRRPRVREARQAARANTCGGEKSNPTGASTRTCIGASAPTPRRTWAAPTLIHPLSAYASGVRLPSEGACGLSVLALGCGFTLSGSSDAGPTARKGQVQVRRETAFT